MAYDMHVIREDNYLHVKVTGDNTPEDVVAYLNEARKVCIEQQVSRVLIEENLAGPPFRAGDMYDVVVEASKDAAPAVRYVAFVDTNPEHDFAEIQFAETVAVNRGVNVRVFRDVPAATTWIREQ